MSSERSRWRAAIRGRPIPPRHIGLVVLMLLALAHGTAYAVIVPIWQAPDETTLYEYAQLIVELGRVPHSEDRSPALEERLVASMERQHFWKYTLGVVPSAPRHTLADVQAIFDMPRQVGGDPPVYFVLAALPLSLVQQWSPERQVLLLRMLNVLLLPGVVVCAYGAAREVIDDRPTFALAVAGLVALQPMLAFIGASLSNDGPANLLGAALCWAFLYLLRHGLSRRRAVLIVCLLALALLIKRTTLPYVVLLPGLAWAARATTDQRPTRPADGALNAHPQVSFLDLRSSFFGSRWSAIVRRWALPVVVAAIVTAWVGQQLDLGATADWFNIREQREAARVSPAGQLGAALLVRSGQEVIQALPPVGVEVLRGQTLRYGVRLWSATTAKGHLVIITGDQRQELPFEVHGSLHLAMQTVVPEQAPDVFFELAADNGWFYADDVWARGDRLRGNLITNSGLELPAVRPGTPLSSALGYLRLRDVVWTLQSGRLTQPLAYSDVWASVLFSSFWGFFGWMRQPYVSESLWMPLLEVCCGLGMLGTLGWLLLRQGLPQQRRQVLALLLLTAAALALMILNAYTQPAARVRPQGRYLFPMMVPIACIIALGQSALLPRGWYRAWLAGWFAFWMIFAGATLAYLISYYG